jgi:hypothetical protein
LIEKGSLELFPQAGLKQWSLPPKLLGLQIWAIMHDLSKNAWQVYRDKYLLGLLFWSFIHLPLKNLSKALCVLRTVVVGTGYIILFKEIYKYKNALNYNALLLFH